MIKSNTNNKRFRFGVEKRPWWFLKKVKSMDIEYIMKDDMIIGCRFYHVYTGREYIINDGQYVSMDMLYAEEPKRVKVRRRKRKTR